MKTKKEILERIKKLEKKQQSDKDLYRSLEQIDMQSMAGNVMRKNLNRTQGEIKALKWVLNENQK